MTTPRRGLLAAVGLLPVFASSSPLRAAEVALGPLLLRDPWTRAARAGMQGAGFLTILNRGQAPDRLVAAASPAARRMELHTHVREGDVMRMRPVPAIELPPGATVRLEPGGLHLMFIGLTQDLREGERVPVTLTFERAGSITLELTVQAPGARAPHGHHRH
ncbi:MAG: copper chaperone PCu(A)C [Rhodovarius sp.]|nr:copper chaperone PCu(A)C [Rhodovarius sp.]